MDDSNYINCRPSNETRETTRLEFNNKLKIWITLYFFIPATTIVVLNAGIVIRLAKAHKLQQKMSMKNSLKNARQNSVKSKVNRQSSGGGSGKQTAARQASHSSAGSSIKSVFSFIYQWQQNPLNWNPEDHTQTFLESSANGIARQYSIICSSHANPHTEPIDVFWPKDCALASTMHCTRSLFI